MLKARNINLLIKICLSALSILLCVLLVFNAGIVDCFAVAGVDDALFWILCAIMAACGVTFVSVEAAQAGADGLWDNLGDDIKKFLEQKANDMTIGATAGTFGIGILVSNYWSSIIDSIATTFGDYTGIDVAFDVTADYTLPLTIGSSIVIPFSIARGSSAKYTIANSSLTILGNSIDFSKFPLYVQNLHEVNTSNFLIIATLGGLFNVVCNKYAAMSPTLSVGTGFKTFNLVDDDRFFYYGSNILSYDIYFNGELLTYTSVGSGFTLTTPLGDNIVQNGYIINTDIPVSDSVCPDGVFDKVGFTDWLNNLAFGSNPAGTVGSPGIDAGAYPGNDVWHDGSINDDIAVGSPSIGIAVPTSDEDVISLNPDLARDYENTTVKDKDIATDTDTGTDTDSDTSTPTNGTPSAALPALSLPEILFKEKFPFCLPWDLYMLFQGLKAEPEIPYFVIPFELERYGIYEEIVIDLEIIDDEIQIVRFFIGAGFVLALILMSRKMIGAD